MCQQDIKVYNMLSIHRQIIARGLLDVFRDFSNNEEDFLTVMEIAVRLSEDAGLRLIFIFFYFYPYLRNCSLDVIAYFVSLINTV